MAAPTIKNGALAKHTLPQQALNNQHSLMSGFGSGAYTVSGELAASSSIQVQVRVPLNVVYSKVVVLAAGDGSVTVQTADAGGSNIDAVGSKVLIGSEITATDLAASQIFIADLPWDTNATTGAKLDSGTNMVLKVSSAKATSWAWIDATITTSAGVKLYALAFHWELENAD